MARDDRVAQLIQLLRDADASGNDDLAQEVRSDLFKEFGLEMNNGGMMNINNMTAPLGYDNGGQVGDKEAMIKSYELAKSLNPDRRISDKDIEFARRMGKGTQRSIGPAGASIVSDDGKRILENKKETGIREKIKDWIKNARENWFAPKQYEGGDDPEYMKLFDFFWKKGYDQQQIDDIIDGKVDPTEIVPSRTGDLTEPFTGAKGGIVSLNHLTRRL